MSTQTPASAGLHHVTAIAGDPRRNIAFFTRDLGLRLVKKTVNFDDPGTYHLYYGDEAGSPGTILTFFPWEGAGQGTLGAGETHETAFRVPAAALDAWRERLAARGIAAEDRPARFGQPVLAFADPDGMRFSLVGDEAAASVPGRAAEGVSFGTAIRSFAGVTLGVADPEGTGRVLTDVLGYRFEAEEGGRRRYRPAGSSAEHLDIVSASGRGRQGRGSVHHIAFRAADDAAQAAMADVLWSKLRIGSTEQKDRTYFRSVYFREPSGVIFEIATDSPGFAIDEAPESLGTALKLPPQYEALRPRIEAALPALG